VGFIGHFDEKDTVDIDERYFHITQISITVLAITTIVRFFAKQFDP